MFDARKFFRIIVGVVLSVAIGAGLMIFVYALPNERVVKNIQADLSLYAREDIAPKWGRSEHSHLDYFTEAIMLDEASHPVDGVVRTAMLNPRYRFTDGERPVEVLIQTMNGDMSGVEEVFYSRYWHGYLTVLKPLLMLFKVNHLRMLLSYAVFITFVVALISCQKILGTAHALAFAAVAMVLNLVSVSLSFQYQTVYFITVAAMIIMLKKNRRLQDDGRYPEFFAAVGIMIAFFDFLTYPIFSVSMLLVLWHVLNPSSRPLKSMGSLLMAWGVGYGGMWSGKWIVSDILTGHGTIASAVNQVSTYVLLNDTLSNQNWDITLLSAIRRNVSTFGDGPIKIFLFVAIILFVRFLFKHRHIITRRLSLPYLLPATLPFVWYAAISGHSHIHAFFTYRSLAATLFALTCMVIEILSEDSFRRRRDD